MKTIPIYNHQKAADGHSIIEHELHRRNRDEKRLRQFCMTYTPQTHGMGKDHVLRDCLPGAYRLEPDALRKLNQILPGVIFQMPVVKKLLIELSIDAVRELKPVRAGRARNRLLKIVMPVDAKRTSTAITPHTANLIQFVAEDFFLVAALYKKELAEADSPASDIRAAIRRAYRDIPPEWIDAVCQSGARIIQLVHRRVGELTRSGGRGEYELWRRMNPGYVGKIKSTAREQAARITLDYP